MIKRSVQGREGRLSGAITPILLVAGAATASAQPAISPAGPATFPLALGPVGRFVALSTLSTAAGGILCADYAVVNTSPGGTP